MYVTPCQCLADVTAQSGPITGPVTHQEYRSLNVFISAGPVPSQNKCDYVYDRRGAVTAPTSLSEDMGTGGGGMGVREPGGDGSGADRLPYGGAVPRRCDTAVPSAVSGALNQRALSVLHRP